MTFDLKLFLNRYAWITLACILAQQSIVASATYVLTRLMQDFQSGQPIAIWLYVYCAAMLVPYVPGCLGHIALQQWINRTHADYVERALETMRRWRGKQVSQSERAFTQTLVGKQSLSLIDDVLRFGHAFVDFLASSLFNVAVLAWMLPGDLAMGYAISTLACTATLFFLRQPIDRLAMRQENAHIGFSARLTQAWDNTVIGNAHNYEQWKSGNEQAGHDFYSAASRLATVSWLANILLAVLTLLPSIYLIISTLNHPGLMPVVAAALIANLTRIFHVLSGVTTLVSQAISCKATFARARVLFEGWPKADGLDNEAARQAALKLPLSINGKPVESRDEAMRYLAAQPAGRFTIRAPNGAGKSTFLHALKFKVGDGAFYLPAHTDGLAWKADLEGKSTGQRMISHLAEIESLPNVTHILLDEWDANLDDHNTAHFDSRLDAAARCKVIVEIRH